METIAIFNQENVPNTDIKDLRYRRAVRGVIFDNESNVAMLYVATEGYYGLPGGGVDQNEDFTQAIVRECKEEIGCTIEIISELGKTLEYRKQNNLLNESHGYSGEVRGEKGNPTFLGDENETEKASTIVWVPIGEAIRLMEDTPPQEKLYSQYCIDRDLIFLKRAQEQTR